MVILPCTIGRKECDFILDDRLVSRRHAELKFVDNAVVIEDLQSKNGTKVNGKKIISSQLTPNDLVSIGTISFRVL
jgi:pSer/pThr/pTyr-binding forkhead associated (FHA) protein